MPKKASFAVAGGDRATGWIVKLSVVGVEVESLQTPPVGSEIVFWAELIDGEGEVAMPGRVQWATFARFSVLFGPLGARETRAVVRATRSSAS